MPISRADDATTARKTILAISKSRAMSDAPLGLKHKTQFLITTDEEKELWTTQIFSTTSTLDMEARHYESKTTVQNIGRSSLLYG